MSYNDAEHRHPQACLQYKADNHLINTRHVASMYLHLYRNRAMFLFYGI